MICTEKLGRGEVACLVYLNEETFLGAMQSEHVFCI
jgi:hypothetical protein